MFGPGDVRFFDLIARAYDVVMPAADADSLAAGLALADRPIDRLLDVAGGTGRAIASVRGPERTVVDASGGMIRGARRRGLPGIRGDARRLPFPDDTFDAALLVDALHHVPDRPTVLREARRVIAPGGVLVIRDFDPTHPLGRLLVAAEHAVGMDSRFYAVDDLERELSAGGFEPHVLESGFGYTVAGVVPNDAPDGGAVDRDD